MAPSDAVKDGSDQAQDVVALADALQAAAGREGLSMTSIVEQPTLLALGVDPAGRRNVAQQARAALERIRVAVDGYPNLLDGRILKAGLNLAGRSEKSYEKRILAEIESKRDSPEVIQGDSASRRFREKLILELAWRILGGVPVYSKPAPPPDDLALAERYLSQHRRSEARSVLRYATETSADRELRRDAWRRLAELAVGDEDFGAAEDAFRKALAESEPVGRGGKLAMAIDRYARRLTELEDYERAEAIVTRGLTVFFNGRWLWRRYGCIKWYAGEYPAAYASLTHALEIGYSASRVRHARGQVLAEMGRYSDAIDELHAALDYERSRESEGYARSALAFSLGMSGELGPALNEFSTAQQMVPQSSWLRYWRGLCYLHHDQPVEAKGDLEWALSADRPLNRPKRMNAEMLLITLG